MDDESFAQKTLKYLLSFISVLSHQLVFKFIQSVFYFRRIFF